jgi:hypothetical protein
MGPLALIPIIAQASSLLAPLLGSPLAGNVLNKAGDIAERVFGTRDPSAIQAQIAADASKAKLEEFKAKLEAETESEREWYADAQNARAQTVQLAQAHSPIAWGAPVMSTVVTVGFLVILTIFITEALNFGEFQKGVVTTLVGYLGGAFQQAVTYWLGSTKGSKDKDNVFATIAATAATATVPTSTVKDLLQSGASAIEKKMFR